MSSPSRPVAAGGATSDASSTGRVWAGIRDWRSFLARAWVFARRYDVQVRAAWILLAIAFVVDVYFVGQHALVRYQAYHADAFDLGNMDQAAWNTLHGNPFRFTNRGLDWQGPPTRLGQHVEPIFLLIAPLYLIHSGPETLLVLQTLALALGGLPLFLLARQLLPELPLVAVAFVVAYYWTPSLLGEALWDFHPVALATPLLLTAVGALAARRYRWFVVAAVLAALTKEDVALSLVPLGLVLWFAQGRPRFGQIVIALSLAWTAFCFFVILPHFSGASGGNTFWYRYAWLGSSAGDAAKNLIVHPWLPLQFIVATPDRLAYIARMLTIGGGFCIFAPYLWLAALPEFAINIFSTHAEQYSGFYQYSAMTVAYLSAASVYGAARLYNAHKAAEMGQSGGTTSTETSSAIEGEGLRARVAALLRRLSARGERLLRRLPVPAQIVPWVVVALLAVATFANVQAANPRLSSFWDVGSAASPHAPAIDALLARVPADAVVAATDTLDPHLSDRYTIYLMPDQLSYTAEYVAVDVGAAAVENRTADGMMFARMLSSGRYRIVGMVGQVTLLQRVGSPLSPDDLAPVALP